MHLKDFRFTDENHFIAMEYHKLILNRTFLVIISEDFILGLKVNGMVSAEGGRDLITLTISRTMAIRGDLTNPYSYIKSKHIEPFLREDIYQEHILPKDKANFKIYRRDITSITFNNRKKWGMGYYPHDGKVYIKTTDGKRREFIILGSQSCKDISTWIMKGEDQEDVSSMININ